MTAIRVWLIRLKGSLFAGRRDAELEQELRHHLELTAEYEAGQNPLDAQRRGLLRGGGMAQSMEALRDQRGLPWLENLSRDVRFGVRALRRSPTFTMVAMFTFALGIGAATTISSVVDTVLLQPLPFVDSERLVRIFENVPTSRGGVVEGGPNFVQFLEWRRRATTITDALAIEWPAQRTIRRGDSTSRVWAGAVTLNGFGALGIETALGRSFGPGDEANPNVAVLSFEAWRRLFQSDRSVVGSTFVLQAPDTMFAASPATANRVITVVGVLPEGVELPTLSADLYTPLVGSAGRSPTVRMIARLAPGISLSAAREEANIIGPEVKPPLPTALSPLRVARFEVEDLKGFVVRRLRPALRVLLGAVALMLVIVAANIANLLLARGTSRQREMAARLALGASRARLVRQVMIECLLLAIAGGALGALIAFAGIALVQALASLEAPGIFRVIWGDSILPRGNEIGVDLTTLTMALGLALATSVAFGVLPALQVSQTAPLRALGSRGVKSSRRAAMSRSFLALAQVAIATILLVGAGLLTRSFIRLMNVENGYDPRGVLTFQLVFPGSYPVARKADAVADVLARLRAHPDVVAAGMTRAGILLPEEIVSGTFVPPSKSWAEMQSDTINRPRIRPVSSGYLTAMSVPLLDGREILPTDTAASAPVIVISRSVARYFFGDRRAVGQFVDWHLPGDFVASMQVVGVVENIRNVAPDQEAGPDIFAEYRQVLALTERAGQAPAMRAQLAMGFLSVAVKTRGNPMMLGSQMVESVRAVDDGIGVDGVIPMERLAASVVARPRFYATLLSLFAGAAAVLASIGVYGVLAYDVVQRTGEIGVRMALGAQRRAVQGLVLRRGALLAVAGATIGLGLSIATTRVLEDLLFGITPLDTGTFALVAVGFALVATAAAYVPARRATHVQPIVALRHD